MTALAGRFGGIAAVEPKTGEILALAGVAFSAPQPPGSVFKIVTTTAALEAHKVTSSKQFPVETEAVIDGVPLSNANGESCGGTFKDSFAHSCNSVFAPLGVEVGAKRLVATAERFGFNEPPTIAGSAAKHPPRGRGHRRAAGPRLDRHRPGPGAGHPAADGVRGSGDRQRRGALTPTLLASSLRAEPRDVAATANTVTRLMEGVVAYGTGTAAAVEGVRVAGKTGTAELQDTRGPEAEFDLADPHQHRRLVHRLRPGGQAANRGGGPAHPGRRGRGGGRPRGAGRARGGPEALSATGPARRS